MSRWISAADMDAAFSADLQASEYSQCFFLPIIGAEHAFYRWAKGARWKKSVMLEEMSKCPRPEYEAALVRAAGNPAEVDRLTEAEALRVLKEIKEGS